MDFVLDNIGEIFIGAALLAVGIVLLRLGVWLVSVVVDRALVWREKWIDLDRQQLDVALIRPDAFNGLLPIERNAVPAITEAVLAHIAQRIDTMRPAQLVPQTITYSPHYAPHMRNQIEGQTLDAEEVGPASFAVPTFGELWQSRQIGPGRIMLGMAEGQPVYGGWKDLYSTAIGGVTGTGKTTTTRFLLAQAALSGARFAVIDPHASAGDDSLAATVEPLRAAMLCDAAEDERDIIELARMVRDIGRQRKAQGHGRDRTPVILAMDETPALLSRSQVGPELRTLLEEIAQEYRKYDVYALCCAQTWLASRTGGDSALRDSFASAYVHRMKRNQARLLLPTEEGAIAERLPTGHAVLWRTSGETVAVAIPNTTAEDMRSVASQVVEPLRQPLLEPLRQPLRTETKAPAFVVAEGVLGDPRAQRAIQMFLDGASNKEILTQVWEVNAGGGDAYQKAGSAWQDIQRAYMRGANA